MISIQNITPEQTWPIRHQVMYPKMQLEDMILPEDQQGEHFGVFENGNLASVVSFFIDGDTAQFRKLATLEEKQGLGYGRMLLNHVIQHSRSLNAKTLWCNARTNKSSFYEKAGFYETDERFRKDGWDFVVMMRQL